MAAARTLIFAPPAGSDCSDWSWAVWNSAAHEFDFATGAPANMAAAGLADHEDCWLILPGQEVLRTAIVVPARNRRQAEQAAPFVLEEYLAEDIESLHLAFGIRERSGELQVAAVDPAILEAWLATLSEQGIRPARAYSAVDLLRSANKDDIPVLVDQGRFWLRAPHGLAMCAERALLEPVLSQIVSDSAPTRITIQHPESDPSLDLAQLEPALQDVNGQGPAISLQPNDLVPEQVLARNCAPSAPHPDPASINLLQGRFQRTSTHQGQRIPWRWAASLAVLLVSAQLASDLVRASWLEQRTAELQSESVALFRAHFPDRQRIPNPRREVEAMLGGSGATGSGFLPLLSATAAEVSAAGEAGNIQLRSLNFNARRGDLTLDMNVSDIDVLESLQSGLEGRRNHVRIESATQEAQGVRGRLRIGASNG